MKPDGHVPEVGEIFVQENLARTLTLMCTAEQNVLNTGGSRRAGLAAARAEFYEGSIARTICTFHEENGGWLRMGDLASFEVNPTPAESLRLFGATVYTCGTWCQGPFLLQILALMQFDDLASMGHNTPEYLHLLIEAVKLAAADREAHYADHDFTDVPISKLTSIEYNRARRSLITDVALGPEGFLSGDPVTTMTAPAPAFEGAVPELGNAQDTSYLCVIDGDGNCFSATPSDGVSGGPMIPGLGLCPSTRGSQSRMDPEHASAIAPGRRPRLTPNPAIAVFDDGRVFPLGTPGGDVQCQAMAQVFLNCAVFGMNPQEAVEAPRVSSYAFPNSFAPHDYFPYLLKLESRISSEVCEKLVRRSSVWIRLA
eukprot:COSAG02_NODE_8547_length_2529_cov_1.539506_3_plen_370_part_00